MQVKLMMVALAISVALNIFGAIWFLCTRSDREHDKEAHAHMRNQNNLLYNTITMMANSSMGLKSSRADPSVVGAQISKHYRDLQEQLEEGDKIRGILKKHRVPPPPPDPNIVWPSS